ncbi:MAG: hypothetical protein R3Y67_07875 [Eubacteriales bacterium]
MGLFSKSDTIQVVLPFVLEKPTKEDREACVISIEAFGEVMGKHSYYYAGFELKSQNYDALIPVLESAQDKKVNLIIKVKNNVVKSFKVDFSYLANEFKDERFLQGGMVGHGIHDTSRVEHSL